MEADAESPFSESGSESECGVGERDPAGAVCGENKTIGRVRRGDGEGECSKFLPGTVSSSSSEVSKMRRRAVDLTCPDFRIRKLSSSSVVREGASDGICLDRARTSGDDLRVGGDDGGGVGC